MVFTEVAETGNWGAWILSPSGTNKWWDPLAAWYGKGNISIFGFADGHAEQRIWQNKDTVDWIESKQNGKNFDTVNAMQDFRFIYWLCIAEI